ncbi:MAG: hypothetical protein JWL61_3824 [Gemmatimonadetes bacterium]|nr:hypothetical protein [Gemmatimonadota bacterium]
MREVRTDIPGDAALLVRDGTRVPVSRRGYARVVRRIAIALLYVPSRWYATKQIGSSSRTFSYLESTDAQIFLKA